jgi:hypothetical protein
LSRPSAVLISGLMRMKPLDTVNGTIGYRNCLNASSGGPSVRSWHD